jgi:hypothetical protein
MQRDVDNMKFLTTDDELQEILGKVLSIIGAPLPQDWEVVFKWIQSLGGFPRAMLNMMHCPKNVSNGGQKTSWSGLAKAIGVESALFGIECSSNTVSFTR